MTSDSTLSSMVYFVQAGDDGPIKIGTAHDVRKRIASLQTGHHEKLRLVAAIDGGREREVRIHSHFAADRISGEWFRPSDRILDFIEKCKDEKMVLWCEITRLCDKYNELTDRDREPRIVYDVHQFSCRCPACWYEHGGRERDRDGQ